MKKQEVIRSIDVGYGNTKYTVNTNGKVVCKTFPSITPRKELIEMSGGILAKRDTKVVTVNNAEYEVGPEAYDAKGSEENRVLHDRYIYSDQYKALVFGALSYMGETVIDKLIVGLPVGSESTKSDDLKEMLTGTHILSDGNKVQVKSVSVLAQPLGGFMNYAFTNNVYGEMRTEKTLIVDPGFLTVDFLTTKGVKAVERQSGVYPGGMSKILSAISKSISKDINKRYEDLHAIDEALSSGKLKIYGKNYDITPHIKASASVVDEAVGYMANVVGSGMDVDNIMVVGGGGKVFYDSIKKHYPNHDVILVDDGIFSNVLGYQIAGEKTSGKEAKNG